MNIYYIHIASIDISKKIINFIIKEIIFETK